MGSTRPEVVGVLLVVGVDGLVEGLSWGEGDAGPGRVALGQEGVQPAVPGVPRGEAAVEDGVAQRGGAHDVVRPPDAEGVQGAPGGGRLGHQLQQVGEQGAVRGERASPRSRSRRTRSPPGRRRTPGAGASEAPPWTTANSRGRGAASASAAWGPERLRGRTGSREEEVELCPAALRPAHGALDRTGLLGRIVLGAGAVVEAHHHVAAELELGLDAALRGQGQLLPAAGLAEDDLVGPDGPAAGVLADQGVDLEAPGVADHRAVPAHEAVHAPRLLDQARAGAAHEVEGVDHDPLHADGAQVRRVDGAHPGPGGVREEDRQGEAPVARGRERGLPWRCASGAGEDVDGLRR